MLISRKVPLWLSHESDDDTTASDGKLMIFPLYESQRNSGF